MNMDQSQQNSEFCIAFGIVITVQSIITISTIYNWILQSITLLMIFIYMMIRLTNLITPYFILFILICGFHICYVCYLLEKSQKDSFILDYQQIKSIKQFYKLFNKFLPSAIIIIKPGVQDCTISFSNKACKSYFQVKNDLEVIPHLKKIFISNKQLNESKIQTKSFSQINVISHDRISLIDILQSEGETIIKDHKEITLTDCYYKADKNQQKKHLSINIIQCRFNNQDQIALVFNDVSEKLLTERMKDLNQYKDMLLATVTHDFKTPLNGMISILQITKDSVSLDEIKKYNNIIISNCYLLLYLVYDILDYSKIQYGKLRLVIEEFDLEDVLQEIKQLIKTQADHKKIAINFINKSHPKVLIKNDKNRTKQVLLNLIGNSLKFTFQGFVNVIIEQKEDNQLTISVQDSGIGIADDLLPNLFQLFGTFDYNNGSNKCGVGLGLSICQKLVEYIGPKQKINIETEIGKGTTFKFQIYKNIQEKSNNQEIQQSQSKENNDNFFLNIQPKRKICSILKIQSESPLQYKKSQSQQFFNLQSKSLQNCEEIYSEEEGNDSEADVDQEELKEQRFDNNIIKKNSIRQMNPKFFFKEQDILVEPSFHHQQMTEFQQLFPLTTRILIVDDNTFNILSLKIILEHVKTLIIDEAYNGVEAIQKIRNREEQGLSPYNLIFMDVNMPLMDGIEAIKIIRKDFQKQKDLKIISCTAYTEVEDIQKCMNSGADGFLGKPITRDSCLEALYQQFQKDVLIENSL